jgi:hypothetical protein
MVHRSRGDVQDAGQGVCVDRPDSVTEKRRELVRLRDRLVQDFRDRLLQLHGVLDLGFPARATLSACSTVMRSVRC